MVNSARLLALAALLACLAAAATAETEFCKHERERCEKRCDGYAMDFDCKDDGPGARAVACSCGEKLQPGSSSTAQGRGGARSSASATTGRGAASSSQARSSGGGSAFASAGEGGEVFSRQVQEMFDEQAKLFGGMFGKTSQ